MDHKNIDKLFKSGLGGYREKAPSGAWNRLDHELNHLNRKKTMVIIRWAAASVLLLLAFGAGYFYATFNIPEPVITEKQPPVGPDITDASSDDEKSDNDEKHPVNIQKLQAQQQNEINRTSSQADQQKETSPSDAFLLAEARESNVVDKNTEIDRPYKEWPLVSVIELPPTPESLFSEDELLEVIVEPVVAIADLGIANEPEQDGYYTPPADSRSLQWTIGAQFAPTYSYREISTNYSAGQNGNDVETYNNAEEPLLAYAGGIQVDLAFNSKWSLNSGMYFSRIGQVNNNALEFRQEKDEFVLSAIHTSTGVINFTINEVPESVRKITAPKDSIANLGPENVKVIQNFDLFEVPFLVKYHLINKKLMINLSGGLSPAYLLRNNTYLEYESSRYDIGEAGNLNNFIINSSLGLGLGYKISNKLTVNIEPTFKYSLSPINSDSKVYYHPYYLSWFTGINYRF